MKKDKGPRPQRGPGSFARCTGIRSCGTDRSVCGQAAEQEDQRGVPIDADLVGRIALIAVDVDGVAGATVSSTAIKNAARAAYNEAMGIVTDAAIHMAPGKYTAGALGYWGRRSLC